LLNRRAMQETLDQQLNRSRRVGDTFAAVMLDIDHFKAINDHHGHAAGDQALKHIAALLRTSVRAVDRVGRFGGEEFVMLAQRADWPRKALPSRPRRATLRARSGSGPQTSICPERID
jgi:diguanylate cyclase (GGDEF)-like protein